MVRFYSFLSLVCLFCSGSFLFADGASRVNEVLTKLKEPKKGKSQESYTLTEGELNAFTEVAIAGKKRLGVKKIHFDLKQGTFATTAVINMDDVQLTGMAFRMFKAVLSGTQTLQAHGKLTSAKGKASYEVESAKFNSIPVPAFLVNAVVSFLGKRQPPHIDVTEPFNLPYGIQEVRIISDKLIVVR
ncbi:MAG: hypothetical protein HY645_05525 [Acidobacteria bacterium]|nr:hypothetical protein [Acidobacteriota bacterium]